MDRALGIKILNKVFKNQKNVTMFENLIFKMSNNSIETYNNLLLYVTNEINNKKSTKTTYSNIKKQKFGWNSDNFIENKNKIEEHDHFIMNPFQIDEGVMECGKCGSRKTYSYTKQTRSGDEATTVFAICCNCNNKWHT